MPRVVAPEFKRNLPAKTGVRLCESRMIKEIADELGIVPSEVVYLAVVKLLMEMRPEECEVNKIRIPMLVG